VPPKNRIRQISKNTGRYLNHKITDKQNAYLATFPELNREPILELDKDGVICYLNPSGKAFFLTSRARYRAPLLSDYAGSAKTIRRGGKRILSPMKDR